MSVPSEEMLAQRQLRAAEIALDSVRRQRRQTEETLRAQQVLVDAAQAALDEKEAERRHDAYALGLAVAAAQARELAAETRYLQEHQRRLSLEEQVAALRRREVARDDLARQLAAEARIAELEGELELISRHAAEFEYRVRMAAFDAFKLVRDLSDVVSGLLQRARILDPPRSSRPPREGDAPRGSGSGSGSKSEDARDPTAYVPAPSVASVLDSQRLDAALARLRATTPPPDDAPG
jgi:hypothetical protein